MTQLFELCGFSLNQKWKFLHRGTRDGFAAAQFHNKCGNSLNTLVIIKSSNGCVFGGYTQQNWSHSGAFKIDPNAFVFSMINLDNNPMVMKCHNPNYAVSCVNNFRPVFGNDISVCDNSNVNTGSFSNLGHSYKHPQYVQRSNEAKSFLAGSYNFQTVEIEVYTKE